MNNRPKKPNPEILPMIVTIVAYVINMVLLFLNTASDGFVQGTVIVFGAVGILVFLFVPVLVRAAAYSRYLNVEGFSVAQVINTYKLTGWIKGKYILFDAIGYRTSNDFQNAFLKYTECIRKTNDDRLKRACYLEIARYMPKYIEYLPVLLEGYEKFPQENEIFLHISSFYMWEAEADLNEGTEWFRKGTENKDVFIRALSYFYLARRALFRYDFENAMQLFDTAISLKKCTPAFNIYIDAAICAACLKDTGKARQYALLAADNVDSTEELDLIKEKLNYIFKINENELHPESQKLIKELKRRQDAKQEDSIKISEVTRID